MEEQLKEALARKAAAGRVRGTSGRARQRGSGRQFSAAMGRRGGGSVMAAGGGVAYRQHQGEVAKEQVMTAMKITAVQLHRIQTHVHGGAAMRIFGASVGGGWIRAGAADQAEPGPSGGEGGGSAWTSR